MFRVADLFQLLPAYMHTLQHQVHIIALDWHTDSENSGLCLGNLLAQPLVPIGSDKAQL